jgi:hypothetical protein
LAQQPLGQVAPLQTQVAPAQTLPAPHAAPFPQVQAPVAGSQLSAVLALQGMQAPPPTPQVLVVGALHAPLRQQPSGQDWPLQTHEPPTHSVPAPQAGLVPHRHSPDAEHRLARVTSQETHAAPLTPHAPRAAPEQVAPEQHPPGQLPALQPLHTPPEQVCAPQSWQAAPPLPQAVFELPVTQVNPEQHPFEHDVPSQTQVPARQRWPAAQTGPAPQAQVPLARQRSAVIPQAVQAPPLPPQAESDGDRQAPAEQQPPGHDTASHTQRPALQCWPPAHVAPPPQAQAPVVEQASARIELQATQAWPPEPQAVSDGALHAVPEQQPFGQLVASHVQDPAEQRWPAAHAAWVPHAQAPAAEQPSACRASHPTQIAPPAPQVAKDGGLQVAPEQQPAGQLVALQPLQAPPAQLWPAGQASQVPPPVPQDAAVSPARHEPAEQQPWGQEVPSQTQVLATQRWPGAHASAPPQRQLPPDEQLSERSSQDAQVAPPAPQLVSDRARQAAP